ncbi:glycogen synthase GlgA [Ketogulonicigenium vulgare]|uniref:glycogen synthase GlgA n=1 Tax=Ketogulonicigenium vulgare TaxID=92945 RepID=UPI00235923A2|nr:glycogen synthase GlgA [Ketogulonicigenium vulgare]
MDDSFFGDRPGASHHRALSITAEFAPLIKVGGLADVAGTLPSYLGKQGWDTRTLMPLYPQLDALAGNWPIVHREDLVLCGAAVVRMGEHAGNTLLLLDAPQLFGELAAPYQAMTGDWAEVARRFAALSEMGACLAAAGLQDGWRPDVVHAHDWHAALATHLIKLRNIPVGTALTLHNASFQGILTYDDAHRIGLPQSWLTKEADHYGHTSFLKAGIQTADVVTTVSPNYARELLQPETGMAMDGYLRARGARFRGILNGIDVAAPRRRSVNAHLAHKRRMRAELCAEFNLRSDGPLAVIVSRLTAQKGLDIVMDVWSALDECDSSLILVGTGDSAIEDGFRSIRRKHPNRVGLCLAYSSELAARLFTGGDCILIPSRFEPCGLTQMYAMEQGTIPIATAVGGLADTIIDATPAALKAKAATGILLPGAEPRHLSRALHHMCALHAQPAVWRQMQINAMRMDFSWDEAAADYAAVYRQARELYPSRGGGSDFAR